MEQDNSILKIKKEDLKNKKVVEILLVRKVKVGIIGKDLIVWEI